MMLSATENAVSNGGTTSKYWNQKARGEGGCWRSLKYLLSMLLSGANVGKYKNISQHSISKGSLEGVISSCHTHRLLVYYVVTFLFFFIKYDMFQLYKVIIRQMQITLRTRFCLLYHQEAEWAQEVVRTLWSRKNLALARIRTPSIQLKVCHFNDWAIPALQINVCRVNLY
jgi:hypothetical protein